VGLEVVQKDYALSYLLASIAQTPGLGEKIVLKGRTQLVTPVQIHLDLQNYRNRGQEAAQAIRKVIEQSW
jgi:predicted nucleotidyltransferase component of viral defense system